MKKYIISIIILIVFALFGLLYFGEIQIPKPYVEYNLAKTPEYKKLHPSVETLAKERIDYYLKEEGYKNSIVERIKIISNYNNEKFKLSITIKDEKNYKKNDLEIEGFITFDSYKFPKDYGDNFYINIPIYTINEWYY